MPEMSFRIVWPDASEVDYYSPSLIVRDYFATGERLALPTFLQRAREAMSIASDRVQQKYGFPCSRARATIAAIERQAETFAAQDDARITVKELVF
jgi:uncharacterized repeat protein (TIGR04042 family)